jgi:hypothetical protein
VALGAEEERYEWAHLCVVFNVENLHVLIVRLSARSVKRETLKMCAFKEACVARVGLPAGLEPFNHPINAGDQRADVIWLN